MKEWGRDWRKLYLHPSREWLSLPVSTRGLGDEMIRVAEADGTIYVGDDPVSGICKAVEAHPLERRRIKDDLDRLYVDGFCSVDGKYIRIRNLVIAQNSVTGSGERMRKHRAKQTSNKPTTDLEQTNDKPTTNDEQTIDVSTGKDLAESVTVTVDKTRLEETRNTSAPSDSEPSLGAGDKEQKSEAKPDKRGANRPDASPPEEGTLAWKIYLVLRDDPQLQPIVPRPSELARRLSDPDAYPAVNVLAQVKLAANWLADNPKNRKQNGPRFLGGWLSRAQERAPNASGQASLFQSPRAVAPDPRLAPPKITYPKGKPISEMTDEERAAAGLSPRPRAGVA